MCLAYDKEVDDRTRARLDEKGFIWGYKVVNRYPTFQSGWMVESLYFRYEWKIGINYSDRRFPGIVIRERDSGYINKGFHFFLTRRAAKGESGYNTSHNIVMKVKCYKKDFVAAGFFGPKHSAVFTQACHSYY